MIAVAVCTAFLVGWICGRVCGDDRDDRLADLTDECVRLQAELDAVRGEYASILDLVEECKAREAEGGVGPSGDGSEGPSCCMSDYLVDVYNNSEVS